MSANTFGNLFRVTTFGESHGKALGCIIDGCPSGVGIDEDFIQSEMDRRRPGGTRIGTARNEGDRISILSGVYEGLTTGTPIAMMLFNENQKSGDYDGLKDVFRPGHADYTYLKKYGLRDPRGGGRSSGRETSARVAAGAVAKLVLKGYGVRIDAAIRSVKDIVVDGGFEPPFKAPLFTVNDSRDEEILALIEKTRKDQDSLGGIVECHIKGVPAGLGDPVFDKVEAVLAHAEMSIGAVKGIEFGLGFGATQINASVMNDQMDGSGFITNNAGGMLGGITTGEDIVFRLAVKPTPSIARPQKTVDVDGNARMISITGRHDVTILVRILPVVEAMAAITIMDLMLENLRYER